MASGSGIKATGEVSGIRTAAFDVIVEGAMEKLGEEARIQMKENMERVMPHGSASGKTVDSVMWRTKNTYFLPRHGSDDMPIIDAPSSDFAVNVGSAYHNATYLEYGTSAHVTNEDADLFVKAIKEWAIIRGIPEEDIYPIITQIREEGTSAHPYVRQFISDFKDRALYHGKQMLVEFFQTRKYVTISTVGWNREVGE